MNDLLSSEIKYSPSQPRDDEGQWSVISGHRVTITGRDVGVKDVKHAISAFRLNNATAVALEKGVNNSHIRTDDHLIRTISHAQQHAAREGVEMNAGHIEAALKVHGRGGTSEGKRERPATPEERALPHLPAHLQAQEEFVHAAKIENKGRVTTGVRSSDGQLTRVPTADIVTGHAQEAKKDAHRVLVERALQNGHDVPDHVLRDYRDLKQKYHGPPTPHGDLGPFADGKTMDTTLIAFGSEIKTFEETPDSYKFEGELVVFGSHDQSALRDRFTKSTEYFVENGAERPVLYHHGLDGTMGKAKLGSARVFVRDESVWVSGELKKRKDYLEKHVDALAGAMKRTVEAKGQEYAPFGLSSGAASHLVERVPVAGGHEIKSWPISEISITPTPAEPLTSCGAIKSLGELEAEGAFDEEEEWKAKRQGPGPNGEEGHWVTHAGKHQFIAEGSDTLSHEQEEAPQKKVTATDASKAADRHGLSDDARRALLKAQAEGHLSHSNLDKIAAQAKDSGNEAHHALEAVRGHKKRDIGFNDRSASQGADEVVDDLEKAEQNPDKIKEIAKKADTHAQKTKGTHPKAAAKMKQAASSLRLAAGHSGLPFVEALEEAKGMLKDAQAAYHQGHTEGEGLAGKNINGELKYNARQPRDDHGRWGDGSGGISVGHALHVAESEGIGEEHHAGIRARTGSRVMPRLPLSKGFGARKSLDFDALEIKAGRVLSADNHARLSELCANLRDSNAAQDAALGNLEAFLDQHGIEVTDDDLLLKENNNELKEDNSELAPEEAMASGANSETKSFDLELEQARFQNAMMALPFELSGLLA